MEQVLCPIYKNACDAPHQDALITEERKWSYLELHHALNSLCHFLKESGVKECQRVAFVARNHPSTILLFFSLFRLRAIACPLSFRLPEQQLHQHIQLLKASHLLDPLCLPMNIGEKGAQHTCIDLNSSATFIFTSGSSGMPKIACHSFANHYYNALGALLPLQLNSSSRWLLLLPLFHVSGIGILFRCFQRGAAVVISELPLIEAIAQRCISHLSLVPTQLHRLLAAPYGNLTERGISLKCILLGGAPISQALLQQGAHLPLFTTFGMTEMSSMITLSKANPGGHAGKLLPFREMKIAEDGQIWVRGKTLFEGYWDPEKESIAKIGPQEWFPTKDIGKLTPESNLEVIGRKDRLFISGGENIQPEEIERALCSIPGIQQASVLPIEDLEFGKRPVAFIDDKTGAHTLESIRQELRSLLPSFMHPIQIFPYPRDVELKPTLFTLKQHLAQVLESPSKNQE
jgi:O-succinylbenzoic acid--CoA ligase